jgi:hypothetical protein
MDFEEQLKAAVMPTIDLGGYGVLFPSGDESTRSTTVAVQNSGATANSAASGVLASLQEAATAGLKNLLQLGIESATTAIQKTPIGQSAQQVAVKNAMLDYMKNPIVWVVIAIVGFGLISAFTRR